MAVEDVFNPQSKVITDPKVAQEKEGSDEARYWEEKRKTARSKREFESEERAARQADNMEANPPEPPLQVKGSVDLGHFDMQAQQKELKETIDRIQSEAKTKMDTLSEKNEHYRDELQKIQITMVEGTLKAQIESLQKALTEGLAKPKDPNIVDQVNQIEQIAGVLGFARPGADAALPSEIRLQMYKMEMDNTQAQRQFEWDKMMSERTWQLELKKLEADAQSRSIQVQQEKEKRGMWATPFESLGTAIARGLIDNGGAVSGSPAKRKRSSKQLQAGENDSGTIECPECGEPMAIPPKARSAVCPSCEAVIPIQRVSDGEPDA